MKTIGITGGTGFVGQHLTGLLERNGYEVIIFTTRVAKKPARKQVSYAHWNPDKGTFDINALKKVNAVVHLGGAGLADKRWTTERKKQIVDSRVKGTSFLISQLKTYAPECRTFIAASATGYYGEDRDGVIPFTESATSSNDFLGDTCRQWEAESQKAADFFRTTLLRQGIVLGKDGGAFPRYVQPLSFGVMPVLGSGRQVVSWIEIGDLTKLILFVLENEHISGVYNAVSPTPVTQKELMQAIGKVKGGIRIPAPVPAFALSILLGEMSGEVLKSCTVSAEKLIGTGFIFDHPDITSAVKAILGKN